MTRPVWCAAVAVAVAVAAAAVAAATVAADTAGAAAADVTITRQPDGWVRAPAGTASTLTVAAVSASGAALTYVWQSALVGVPSWAWTNVPGAPSAATFTATHGCTTKGNGQFVAADLRRYRVVVRGDARSAGVASRESVWEPTLDAGTVTDAPPAVMWVPLGAPLRLAWSVSRPASGPGTSIVTAEFHNRKPLPDRYREVRKNGRGEQPGSSTLTLPPVTAADDGLRFVASYFVTCGEDLYSANTKTAVTTLRVYPAACPVGLDAQAGEYGGADLVPGDAHHLPSCGACAAACAATPLCDTWAYAADAAVPRRHRECWLRRRRAGGAGAPYVKPPSAGGWVSGVLPAPARCPAATAVAGAGVDVEGEVLVRGDAAAARVADCGACAAACRVTYGCNVYVFGFDRGSSRAGECWLKRSASPGAPAIKPWTGGGASPWVSGVFLQTASGQQ